MNFQPNNKTRVASIVVISIVKDTTAHGRNLSNTTMDCTQRTHGLLVNGVLSAKTLVSGLHSAMALQPALSAWRTVSVFLQTNRRVVSPLLVPHGRVVAPAASALPGRDTTLHGPVRLTHSGAISPRLLLTCLRLLLILPLLLCLLLLLLLLRFRLFPQRSLPTATAPAPGAVVVVVRPPAADKLTGPGLVETGGESGRVHADPAGHGLGARQNPVPVLRARRRGGPRHGHVRLHAVASGRGGGGRGRRGRRRRGRGGHGEGQGAGGSDEGVGGEGDVVGLGVRVGAQRQQLALQVIEAHVQRSVHVVGLSQDLLLGVQQVCGPTGKTVSASWLTARLSALTVRHMTDNTTQHSNSKTHDW